MIKAYRKNPFVRGGLVSWTVDVDPEGVDILESEKIHHFATRHAELILGANFVGPVLISIDGSKNKEQSNG